MSARKKTTAVQAVKAAELDKLITDTLFHLSLLDWRHVSWMTNALYTHFQKGIDNHRKERRTLVAEELEKVPYYATYPGASSLRTDRIRDLDARIPEYENILVFVEKLHLLVRYLNLESASLERSIATFRILIKGGK